MRKRESRTGRIRRSRKRPLGEAASSPPSMLDREKRQRGCGCAGAATHIFSSAGGQKIRAQQHRPLGGSPKAASTAELQSSVSFLFLPSPPSLIGFFRPRPPAGTRARRAADFGGGFSEEKPTSRFRSGSRAPLAFSRQSEHLIRNGNRSRRAHPWPSLAAHDARRLPGASPTFQRTPPIAHVRACVGCGEVQHLSSL